MKTTVLLFGLVQRSLKHVIGDLRRNLFGPLASKGSLEIIYHTWRTGPLANERAGEFGQVVEPEVIAHYLPEAHGRVDNEDDFLGLIDWQHVQHVNPMRHHCAGEEAARVAIRNVLLTLHSLEMAFDEWPLAFRGETDLVVASRADLRFLRPLILPENIEEWTIYLPEFHGWGGVNDRFAFGLKEAMEVYARRSAFFDGFMLHPSHRNPEWVLMKWLERNRLRIARTDMVFQRIRADGSVFSLDQELECGPRQSLPVIPSPFNDPIFTT